MRKQSISKISPSHFVNSILSTKLPLPRYAKSYYFIVDYSTQVYQKIHQTKCKKLRDNIIGFIGRSIHQ